jgi:hypothetical protein
MFYKRLCDQWECEADDAIAEQERQQGRAFSDTEKAVFRKRGEHRFQIPDGSRWGDVKAKSTNPALRAFPSDVLGRAYEYLIKQFADDAGAKAGEFFTPPEVVDTLVRILELLRAGDELGQRRHRQDQLGARPRRHLGHDVSRDQGRPRAACSRSCGRRASSAFASGRRRRGRAADDPQWRGAVGVPCRPCDGGQVRPAARRIASADRSMSASPVDQLLIEIRMAAVPLRVVPLSQHVPSACTRETTSRVNASPSPPPGGSNRTRT